MSITCVQLITDALRLNGVLRETQTASAEQAEAAKRKLDHWLAALEKDGSDLGFYPVALASTMPLEDWAILPITYNLAVLLAPDYGATITAEIAGAAMSGMRLIDKAGVKPRRLDFSHVPTGVSGGYDITTDEGA